MADINEQLGQTAPGQRSARRQRRPWTLDQKIKRAKRQALALQELMAEIRVSRPTLDLEAAKQMLLLQQTVWVTEHSVRTAAALVLPAEGVSPAPEPPPPGPVPPPPPPPESQSQSQSQSPPPPPPPPPGPEKGEKRTETALVLVRPAEGETQKNEAEGRPEPGTSSRDQDPDPDQDDDLDEDTDHDEGPNDVDDEEDDEEPEPCAWPQEDAKSMRALLTPLEPDEPPDQQRHKPIYPPLIQEALSGREEQEKQERPPRSFSIDALWHDVRYEETIKGNLDEFEILMVYTNRLKELDAEDLRRWQEQKEAEARARAEAGEPEGPPLPRPVPEIELPCQIPPKEELPDEPPFGYIKAVAGANKDSPPQQLGILGEDVRTRGLVALSLAASLCICMIGTNDSGKSYTLSVVAEMFLKQLGMINLLANPVCGVVFHLHRNGGYLPELISMVFPNIKKKDAEILAKSYETLPEGLKDVVLLTLGDVGRKQAENPHLKVMSLRTALREQGMDVLRILLGLAQGASSPLYVRKVEAVIKRLIKEKGQVLTWERLVKALIQEKFDKAERRRLIERLGQVRPFIDDRMELKSLIRPGRLIIVDISEMWEDPEQAVLLCAVAMRILCMGEERRKPGACPLLVAIDEAHKFFIHKVLAQQLEYMVRERRHLGLNLIFGSQDPESIPGEVLALMDMVGMLQHDSPQWIRYLAKYIAAFKGVKATLTKKLAPGLMLLWAKRWFKLAPEWDLEEPLRMVLVRPRVTLHGGETRGPGAM